MSRRPGLPAGRSPRTRPRSALAAMLLVIAMLLVACGADDGAADAPEDEPDELPADDNAIEEAFEDDDDEDDAGDEAADEEVADGEDVTIEVYSWRPEDAEGYREIFDAFEADHPGISVEFSPFSSTDYDQILQTALQSGSGPDVIQLRPYRSGMEIADQGYLEPLSDLEGLEEMDSDFLDAARGSDDEVYGVPLALNAAVIMTNQEVFDEHGVEEPTTWPELMEAAEQFSEQGIVPFAQAGDAAYLLSLTHAAVGPGAYGTPFVDDIREGATDFTDPGFRESVERMAEIEQYFPDNFVGLSDDEVRGMFAVGEAAMYINGDYRIEPLLDLNPDLQMGVIPSLPDENGDALLTTWVDGSYAAYADTEHPEEVRQLLSYMTTTEFGEAFSSEFNRTSPVEGVEADDELRAQLIELTEASSTPYLVLTDFSGSQPDTKEEFENALQGMYVGELDIDEVVDTAQRSAESWYEPFAD